MNRTATRSPRRFAPRDDLCMNVIASPFVIASEAKQSSSSRRFAPRDD